MDRPKQKGRLSVFMSNIKKNWKAQKKVFRNYLKDVRKLFSGNSSGRKNLKKDLNAQKKVLQDVSKEVVRLFTGTADLSRIRDSLEVLWEDVFLEILKRVLIVLALGILGLFYLLPLIDFFPYGIPVIGMLDGLGIIGLIILFFLSRRIWMVAILIFIIPLVVGFLLGLISRPLGIVAGIAAMVFGFWKVGTDSRYF